MQGDDFAQIKELCKGLGGVDICQNRRSRNVSTRRMPAAKRKQQILLSAIRVFARSTYHGATTKSIAEEAGVTEALLYRYFGSKRDIFTEAIQHTAGRLTRGLEEILDRHRDDPLEAISECVDYYVNILESHRDMARMIFLVLAELDEEDVRQIYLPIQTQAVEVLAEHIERWQKTGYVVEELNADDTAWLFYGSYMILAQVKQSRGKVRLDPGRVVGLIRPYLTQKGMKSLDDLAIDDGD